MKIGLFSHAFSQIENSVRKSRLFHTEFSLLANFARKKMVAGEKDRACANAFESKGPYWHLYTSGKETPLIFIERRDYEFAMNAMAMAAYSSTDVAIIAFAVMNNHIHILASGSGEGVSGLFAFVRKKIARAYKERRNEPLPDGFCGQLKEVADLAAMRNTIVYINRNGFVADSNHTIYSYMWGTGPYYFGADIHSCIRFCDVGYGAKREMFLGRVPSLPADWEIAGAYVDPRSYCAVDFGMSLFRNAHHYSYMAGKNVEAYRELALEIGDCQFLTDAEAFAQIQKSLRDVYGAASLSEISKGQKIELSRKMHYDFRSSNAQIRRVLGLSQFEIDSLFPQSARM